MSLISIYFSPSLSYQSVFSHLLLSSHPGNISYWLLYFFLYLSSFVSLLKANLKSEAITALQQLRDSQSQTHIEFERKTAREREMVRHISPLFIFHYLILLFLRFVYGFLILTAKQTPDVHRYQIDRYIKYIDRYKDR